jgi:hypothetical protein
MHRSFFFLKPMPTMTRHLIITCALFAASFTVKAQGDDLYFNPDLDIVSQPAAATADGDQVMEYYGQETDDYGQEAQYNDDDEYDGYEYSSRMRRFNGQHSSSDYYDPSYTDIWYYDPTNYWSPGVSIYCGNGLDYWSYRRMRRWQRYNNSRYWNDQYAFNNWMQWNSANAYGNGWNNPWNNPWSNPYGYNNPWANPYNNPYAFGSPYSNPWCNNSWSNPYYSNPWYGGGYGYSDPYIYSNYDGGGGYVNTGNNNNNNNGGNNSGFGTYYGTRRYGNNVVKPDAPGLSTPNSTPGMETATGIKVQPVRGQGATTTPINTNINTGKVVPAATAAEEVGRTRPSSMPAQTGQQDPDGGIRTHPTETRPTETRPNTETRPADRPNNRPTSTPPVSRTDTETRPVSRPDEPATRPATRPSEPESRPATRPERPTSRPEPESRPAPRPESRPAPRQESRPEPRPEPRQESRPAPRAEPRQESRPAPQRSEPASRPAESKPSNNSTKPSGGGKGGRG